MMNKVRNYITVEATYGEETFQSDKIMAINNGEDLFFDEIFGFDSALRITNYNLLEDFVTEMLDMSENVFGDGIDSLMITLVSGVDDTFIWSVRVEIEEDNMSYGVIDWKKDGLTYKYCEA
jgi:hypothetical protein